MRRPSTTASRFASVVCLAIGILVLTRLVVATSSPLVVLEVVLCVMAVGTGVKMWFHNCFESHLVAVLVSAGTVLGTLLHLTLGLPGGDGPGSLDAASVVLVVLGATIAPLLVADSRARRAIRAATRRPYAP
jgi:hypothetical protein